MIPPESSPLAGRVEVREIMVDPPTERPETSISGMGQAQITAYATEVTA